MPNSISYLERYDPRAHALGAPLKIPPVPTPDGTREIPRGLQGQWGSSWDEQRLFAYFQDDLLFMRGPIEDYLIEGMLQVDGKARALEQVLTLPIRGAQYAIQKPEGDTGQKDFIESVLMAPMSQGGMKTPIQRLIGQISSACLYRRAHFEKVMELRDGQVVYKDVAFRPSTTCYLARSAFDASFQGFLQWTWIGEDYVQIYIPAVKSYVFIHGLHRNPILGTTDLDVAYRAFDTKQKLRWLWASYLEQNTNPRVLAKHNDTDMKGAAGFARQLSTLKGGGVVGLAQGQDATVLESTGAGATTFLQAINYLDSEMTSSVLASFLDLAQAAGAHGTGSFALSLSQTDFYLQSRQAVLEEISESITHDLIAPLVRWNFGHKAPVPRFHFESLAETGNTVENAVTLLSMLAQQSIQPGKEPVIPQEFIDQLTCEVARMINLDEDKVAEAIQGRTERIRRLTKSPATAANAPLHAAADVAADAVAQGGQVVPKEGASIQPGKFPPAVVGR